MASTPYSVFRRWATTSNCSWPTAPSSRRAVDEGLEHLDRAFLAEFLQALLQLLGASAGRAGARRKSSGAK
jgi:hypothetical protein